jgi:hypothetical protein
MEEEMTTSDSGGSPATTQNRTGWFRRTVMATAFVAAGALTFGAAATPAQAYYYGPYYGPHYTYYHPYYGYWGYPGVRVGWGWHRSWGYGGWHNGWHRW